MCASFLNYNFDFLEQIFAEGIFKYIDSGINLDSNKYKQKLPQSGWRITTFCHKIYIFGFHLLEAILK